MQKSTLNLIAVGLMSVMVNLDVTIVNVALPTIGGAFHLSLSMMQWIINIYLMMTAMFFVLAGKIADQLGHRRVYLLGLIFFFVGSALAGLAVLDWMLILGRLLQGLGVAFSLTQAFILALRCFPPDKKGHVLGLLATGGGVAQAIGPTLGGVILHFLSWRWIFFLNLPLTGLSFLLTYAFCAKDTRHESALQVSLLNIAFFGMGVFFLMLSLNQLSSWGGESFYFMAAMALGLCLLGGFVCMEYRAARPLIGMLVLANSDFMSVCIMRLLYMFGWGVVVFTLPLFLQNLLGYSEVKVGLFLFAMTGVFACLTPFTGKWVDRVGVNLPIILSLVIGFFGLCLLIVFASHPHLIFLFAGLFLYGVCAGINIPAGPAAALKFIPQNNHGTGLGFFYTLAFMGAAAGIALGGGLLNILAKNHLAKLLAFSHRISTTSLDNLSAFSNGSRPLSQLSLAGGISNLNQEIGASFVFAYQYVLGFACLLILVAMILMVRVAVKK